jgi:ribonucleotide monophosphatase NagD (HAD superfamily)
MEPLNITAKKLAIIDLDGVIANSDARFAKAAKPDGGVNWRVAFDPALVSLDQLIDGAVAALNRLEEQGFTIIILTSRPESMKEATAAWLAQHDLHRFTLQCKPASEQFTKTVRWKAKEVRKLIEAYKPEVIVFVDDEAGNRESVLLSNAGIACHACFADYFAGQQI